MSYAEQSEEMPKIVKELEELRNVTPFPWPSLLYCDKCKDMKSYKPYVNTPEDNPEERAKRVLPIITIYPKCDGCGNTKMTEYPPMTSVTIVVEIKA